MTEKEINKVDDKSSGFVDERLYSLAVSFLSGVGDINAKKLISRFGSAEAIFKSSLSELKKVSGIGDLISIRLFNSFASAIQQAEEELLYIYANDIEFVTYTDAEYPSRLRECDDAPMVIYYKGKADFNSPKIISIVGTRNATKYGTDFCTKLIEAIASKYPETIIVSGLAYGIDISAHREALKNNLKTWAVMGHSLETVYPAKHKRIAQKMIDTGSAIISDFPHGSKTETSNFVKRNRIVAGLCDALVIVESGVKGGSMITANIANHYNKDVFALPGSVNSIYSEGCNRLIKTNRANLVESLEDIEYIMNWSSKSNNIVQQNLQLLEGLTENEKIIVDVLKNYEYLDIDNILRQSNLNSDALSLCLLELEFKNIVRALPGKIFTLKLK
ncbi:MAG TPA: DNA-processing protein DprA [Bacteroidales bacterium]|nr:DNA-processing protein DprA [Bacteroidales bacterium]